MPLRRSHLLFFIILCITINSCTKKETEIRLSEFEPPIITGFILKNDMGEIFKRIGVPNVKLGSVSNEWTSPYYFSLYPNPSMERIFVHFRTPADGELKKIWITQANVDNQVTGGFIGINNANNMVVGGSPLFQAVTTDDNMMINLSWLPEGYYRIYLKVSEHLLYDNLIIYRPK